MAKEIELKLSIPTIASSLLRQHPALSQAISFDQQTLTNIYFDTQDLKLNKARVALRIRKAGDRYIQTLKTSGSGSGGLHERGEWEWELNKPELNLNLIEPDCWPAALDADQLKTELQPAFETNFTRQRWMLHTQYEHLSAEIELVHDQGDVIAQGKKDPICEIELELKSGDADLLFKVAHDLSDSVPLLVSNISKAQRGFRLFAPASAGLTPRCPAPFNNTHGLISAAQSELDQAIAVRDQLAFNRDWSLLDKLYDSIRQLRWCLLHLSRLKGIPESLHFPTALRYKMRMLSYSLERLATMSQQKTGWERLDHCPDELRASADFSTLNEYYQSLMTAPWAGQTLLETMQWLYLLKRELPESDFANPDALFQRLLRRVHLPRYPTDKVLWLRQQAPLLHLSRWISYQYPMPPLGLKSLQQQMQLLLQGVGRLSGLMAEEIALTRLEQENTVKGLQTLIERNQADQYDLILELGRFELTFNSLQQNLLN